MYPGCSKEQVILVCSFIPLVLRVLSFKKPKHLHRSWIIVLPSDFIYLHILGFFKYIVKILQYRTIIFLEYLFSLEEQALHLYSPQPKATCLNIEEGCSKVS